MTALLLPFPNFDPVLVHLGPISIRWYALAYITGLLIGWWGMRRLVRRPPPVASLTQVDDFLTWATHDGQKFSTDLDYAPLSGSVQKKIEAAMKDISFGGSPVASN